MSKPSGWPTGDSQVGREFVIAKRSNVRIADLPVTLLADANSVSLPARHLTWPFWDLIWFYVTTSSWVMVAGSLPRMHWAPVATKHAPSTTLIRAKNKLDSVIEEERFRMPLCHWLHDWVISPCLSNYYLKGLIPSNRNYTGLGEIA